MFLIKKKTLFGRILIKNFRSINNRLAEYTLENWAEGNTLRISKTYYAFNLGIYN